MSKGHTKTAASKVSIEPTKKNLTTGITAALECTGTTYSDVVDVRFLYQLPVVLKV